MAQEKGKEKQSAAASGFGKAAKIYFKENAGIIVALLVLCVPVSESDDKFFLFNTEKCI